MGPVFPNTPRQPRGLRSAAKLLGRRGPLGFLGLPLFLDALLCWGLAGLAPALVLVRHAISSQDCRPLDGFRDEAYRPSGVSVISGRRRDTIMFAARIARTVSPT